MSDLNFRIKEIKTPYGTAKGISAEWENGQYCAILTPKGQIGCSIFDLNVMEEFDMLGAIAKGTPEVPLRYPEDLFDAIIIGVTPKASKFGIIIGMRGKEVLELLLQE